MGNFDFSKQTIQWEEHVVRHDSESFPNLERVNYDGREVLAYANRPESLYDLFARAVETAPEQDFLVFPDRGESYTYRAASERVMRVAAGLRDAGVDPGDRVVAVLSNGPEFVEVFLALARIGAVAVPLNAEHTSREFGHMLEDTQPSLVVVDSLYLDSLEESSYELDPEETVIVGSTTEYRAYDSLSGDGHVDVDPPSETSDLCILYTSGTTGLPKGVPADHFHIVNGALNNAHCFGLEEGTIGLFPTPLFHVMALVSGLLAVTSAAGTATIMGDYSPKEFLAAIEREQPSYVMAVPTNYVLAVERGDPMAYDTSSIETLAYGGAPMSGDALDRIREAFPEASLCNSYGKTESVSGLAAMIPGQYTEANPDAVGIPTPVMEFTVVDESGTSLPPGETGELLMSGPIIVNGYRNLPEKTDAEFEDGWHYTGDIGTIDSKGFIRLLGRKNDLIIRGGENIYPSEIKDVLTSHDGVIEACVTGFPDDILGERVFASVVPADGVRLTETELRTLCAQHLAENKVPDIFRIVDELPRNAAGTVDKETLVPDPLQFGIKSGN